VLGSTAGSVSAPGKLFLGLWLKFDPGPVQLPQDSTLTGGGQRTETAGLEDTTTEGRATEQVTYGDDGKRWTEP
jgi:hypothetical protein